MAETDLKQFLKKLYDSYYTLQVREANYVNSAPIELLNQINDYEQAIDLTEQAFNQEISLEELQVEFRGFTLQIDAVVFVPQEPPRKPFTGVNPYRGLRKFTEDEAEFFFGRDAATNSLLETAKTLVETETSRQNPDLVAVLGASGSGKSSLVRGNRGFVILTMRADFYAKAAQYKNLAETITRNQMLVNPLSEKELHEAILLPAEAVGLEVEKDLAQKLLDDTVEAPGVLPLLQHVLMELFERRDGNLLTMQGYNEIGGVKGALARRADAILEDMPEVQQQAVRRI